MEVGFSIDPAQGLTREDELACVRLGSELGYRSAWTPGRADATAFDRCLDWFETVGIATGIAVVPASGQPPQFYAKQAARLWEASGGHFVLGLGSGRLRHPAQEMAPYLDRLRSLLPPRLPLYLAALGPRMLRLAAERADGVSLNWCTADQVVAARAEVEQAARSGGRPVPPIASYIRTAVDPDRERAAAALGDAMRDYALGPVAYRRHFERMGYREDLNRLEVERGQPSAAMLSAVGVAAEPGAGRQRFLQQARGLDLAIVRVLVTAPGDASSARRVLEECRPR